jgi:hypothetical protein
VTIKFHGLSETEGAVAVGSSAVLGDWLDTSGSLGLKRLNIAAAKQVTPHVNVARNDIPQA